MISLFLKIIGLLIIFYIYRIEKKSIMDRPLFWTNITMTTAVLVGVLLIIIGFLNN